MEVEQKEHGYAPLFPTPGQARDTLEQFLENYDVRSVAWVRDTVTRLDSETGRWTVQPSSTVTLTYELAIR